jgi:hypothetical protein
MDKSLDIWNQVNVFRKGAETAKLQNFNVLFSAVQL